MATSRQDRSGKGHQNLVTKPMSELLIHENLIVFNFVETPLLVNQNYFGFEPGDLTATERAASRLPKSSKRLIPAEMSTIAQKLLKRLPLKFKMESFGAKKMF